jgi:hypothetical protein
MSTWAKLPAQRRFYRAFLSHAHTDKSFVEQLDHWLYEKAGIPIWYDKRNLPPTFYTFLATSFDDEQRNLNIKQAIQHITAMPCIIGDKLPESHIRELIAEQISKASLVIADISDDNINSCIEAGIAIGAGRPLRLIARAPRGGVPFMLGNHEVFKYNDDAEMLAAIHRIAFPLRRRVINSELPR